jgi:ParB/RepB/Spo0J family partition protein
MNIQIAQIKVVNRFRKDLGDIRSLAKSISEVGLIHPIVVSNGADYQLIAGQRRLKACKLLGWKEVPVIILNIKEMVAGELHENFARKDFAMSERIAILEEIERQRIRHKVSKIKGDNLSPFQLQHKTKKSRSIVSEMTGISEGKLSKEKLIVRAARDNPGKFSSLIAKIDNGKISVDKAYKELRNNLWRDEQVADNEKLKAAFKKATDKCELLEGDFREVGSKLKSSSVDLIFTDPPYAEKTLSLYKDLAKVAERVLRSGGSLVTYVGQYALPNIINGIIQNSDLSYWWELCIQLEGPFARHYDRQLVVKWKPLLWFVKGSRPSNPSFPRDGNSNKSFLSDLILSKRPEKRFHNWGQSLIEAEYIVKFLTAENELVLDPFLGGGTTAIACTNLCRKFIGIDKDPKALAYTRANLGLNSSLNL